MDIHKSERKLKNLEKRIRENCTDENKKIIFKFQKEMQARGLSRMRIYSYMEPIYLLSKKINKPIKDLTKDEVKEQVAWVESNEKFAEYTKSKYKRGMKKFFQFCDGLDWKSEEFSDRCNWIKTTARKNKLPKPMALTKDEILSLFRAAKCTRDKALVSFMYESGCRSPDELLHMKIEDIEFDDYGARVKLTSGKVGSRTIRLVACIPHLKTWLEKHPNPKPTSYLWIQQIGNGSEPITYQTLQWLVRKWTKVAGINKVITPYTFRRTRYTHLASKIPTPALYKFMGQEQGSKTIERYLDLNQEQVDDAVLNFYGVPIEQKNGDIKPLFCSRCNKQNSPELEFCNICHAPLTEQAVLKAHAKVAVDNRAIVEKLVMDWLSNPAEYERMIKVFDVKRRDEK